YYKSIRPLNSVVFYIQSKERHGTFQLPLLTIIFQRPMKNNLRKAIRTLIYTMFSNPYDLGMRKQQPLPLHQKEKYMLKSIPLLVMSKTSAIIVDCVNKPLNGIYTGLS